MVAILETFALVLEKIERLSLTENEKPPRVFRQMEVVEQNEIDVSTFLNS